MPTTSGASAGEGGLQVVVLRRRAADQRARRQLGAQPVDGGPVATVDGPVVGTTWFSVQPPDVGPGTVRRHAPVVRERAQRRPLGRGRDQDLRACPGAPGPKAVGHLVVADAGVGRGRARW